jgi:hypothetical protein
MIVQALNTFGIMLRTYEDIVTNNHAVVNKQPQFRRIILHSHLTWEDFFSIV